jgi:hypothetical protein
MSLVGVLEKIDFGAHVIKVEPPPKLLAKIERAIKQAKGLI